MKDNAFILADALGELIMMLDGKDPTPQQLAMYCKSLVNYPLRDLQEAFRLTLEEDERFIFSRLMNRVREKDGRPTAEAMWIEICADESQTQWRTDESIEAMPQAKVAALSVAIDERDKQQIAQIRGAFKTDYEAAVKNARRESRPVRWHESIGFDKDHRITKMQEALQLGRVDRERATELLPDMSMPDQRTDLSARSGGFKSPADFMQ